MTPTLCRQPFIRHAAIAAAIFTPFYAITRPLRHYHYSFHYAITRHFHDTLSIDAISPIIFAISMMPPPAIISSAIRCRHTMPLIS